MKKWPTPMSPSLETAREYRHYTRGDESRLLARMCDGLTELIESIGYEVTWNTDSAGGPYPGIKDSIQGETVE